MASWLVRSTADQVVRVRALAGVIVAGVVFLGKTLYFVQMGTMLGVSPAMD